MENSPGHKRPASISFERKILLFFLLVIAIIGVLVYLALQVNAESRRNRDLVTHTETVLSLIDSMLVNERDMILGTRSYIITGNETYLQLYEQRHAAHRNSLRRLSRLTGDNPVQQRRLDTIQKLYTTYKVTRDSAVALRKAPLLRMDAQQALTEKADAYLANIKEIFDALRAEEINLLEARKQRYEDKLQYAGNIFTVMLIIFLVVLFLAFILVYRNAVKRRKAEHALQKSEDLVTGIINHAPVLVNVKDKEGRYLLVNHQMAASLNAGQEEMIGKTNTHFLPSQKAEVITDIEREVMQSGQTQEMEVRLPGPDGIHTYITSKFPLFDEKGALYAIGSTSFDITPLKKAHEALEKSYQQQQKILNGLQQTLSASSDLLCIINDKGEIVMISDTATTLFGYSSKEMMSKPFMDFIAEEDRTRTALVARHIMEGEPIVDFTNRYRKKDGTLIPLSWTAKWVEEDKLMYCIARDATEQLNKARQLAQSQARLSHAQKIARLGNWDWDLSNNEWSCSDEVYNLLGITKEEGQDTQNLLLSAIHPDDRLMVETGRDEAITQGKNLDLEHRILRPDGQVCYMHTRGEVSFDRQGQPTWFSGTIQDITKRKQAELKLQQLNEDLQKRAAELKASNDELERFAYVASHDLQEPLRMVSSFLGLLEKKHTKDFDETSKKYIHFAVDGAERMKGLIQDLLHYSRLGSSGEKFVPVAISQIVDDVLRLYGPAIASSRATIHCSPLPEVSGNKVQLTQLFQNLVGNAMKYRSEKSPEITITCTEEERYWKFEVKDNGIGIDPKYFDKIFVIFQRLHNKEAYSGSGIGLAICKKIVENHGGRIWVESAKGQGSSFFFTLKKITI